MSDALKDMEIAQLLERVASLEGTIRELTNYGAIDRNKAAAIDAIESGLVDLYRDSPGEPYQLFYDGRGTPVFPENLSESINRITRHGGYF